MQIWWGTVTISVLLGGGVGGGGGYKLIQQSNEPPILLLIMTMPPLPWQSIPHHLVTLIHLLVSQKDGLKDLSLLSQNTWVHWVNIGKRQDSTINCIYCCPYYSLVIYSLMRGYPLITLA